MEAMSYRLRRPLRWSGGSSPFETAAILKQEGRLTVARSLSVDKDQHDARNSHRGALLRPGRREEPPKIPTHGEERERASRDLVRRDRKPVVLIVDEAHDLH
jgi:type II secretory pathway predicted ATPase ExeA